ncbi:hypothetical protein ACGFNU_10620 [Spirillospora sp. NPDC048911]|uniref:hypothetical protein n=1 Tax=Spirillospora sp. NPDC048911 TaxID=3364527 RepID=UPI00371BD406
MAELRPPLRLDSAGQAALAKLTRPGEGSVIGRLKQTCSDGEWALEEVRHRAHAYSAMLAAGTDSGAAAWAEALRWFGARISRGSAPLYAQDQFERRFGSVVTYKRSTSAKLPNVEERPRIYLDAADMARLTEMTAAGGDREQRLARLLEAALDGLTIRARFVRTAEQYAAALNDSNDPAAGAWAEALKWVAGGIPDASAAAEAHQRLLSRFPSLSGTAAPSLAMPHPRHGT